jgi:hypothetical protein
MADDADGDGWKFSVDDVGPDEESDPIVAESELDVDENGQSEEPVELTRDDVPEELVDEQSEGNVAGSATSIGPIEPETPSIENAAFVVVGVYAGVAAILTMIAPGFLTTPANLTLVAGGVLAAALLSLGFFGVLTPDT